MRYFQLFILLLFAIELNAQETIFTDRPNVTDAVALLNKGTVQIEMGYLRISEGNPESTFTTTPNFSLKYGLSDRVELRILTNYAIAENMSERVNGLTPITLSPKIGITKQDGLVPRMSVATSFTFANVGASEFQVDEFSYGFRYLFEYSLPVAGISWSNSIGTDWPKTTDQIWVYSSAFGIPISGNLSGFVEIYGFLEGSSDRHFIDGGLAYLLSDHIQLDVIYGFNLTSSENQEMIGFGAAWKIN